jgi:hypothetical protein
VKNPIVFADSEMDYLIYGTQDVPAVAAGFSLRPAGGHAQAKACGYG